jgi:cellulose biosynthesis protein BcsQ
LRAALTISDTFLIPVLPRSFDIWAVDQVAELVKEAREALNPDLRACIFLNAVDAQGHDNEDSADALKDVEGIELSRPLSGAEKRSRMRRRPARPSRSRRPKRAGTRKLFRN